MPPFTFSHPAEDSLVQKNEQFFLTFIVQAVHFIQKQHPSVCCLQKSLGCTVCPCKRSFYISEQIAGQQLHIVGVLGTIQRDERRPFRKYPMTDRKLINLPGHVTLSGPGIPVEKYRQACIRIKYGSLDLLDSLFKTSPGPNHTFQRIVSLPGLSLCLCMFHKKFLETCIDRFLRFKKPLFKHFGIKKQNRPCIDLK